MVLDGAKWDFTGRLSFKVILFSALLGLLYFISCTENKDRLSGILYSDAEGYNLYLPAVFVYHGFEQVPVETKIQFRAYPGTRKIFTKYTCGVAILESPFFLMVHAWKLITDSAAAEGCGEPYIRAVMFAGCFYALAGLFILFYALRRKFTVPISLITVSITFLGTNLYYYTICAPGMSHVYSFFLFAIVVWLTPLVLYNASIKKWVLYGFVLGLVVLTRPTNAVLLVYPLLYDCYSLSSFKQRLILFKQNIRGIILSALAAFTVFIPQFLYWQYLSGHFIMDSYNTETFQNWYTPKIWKVLFDVQNGWLLYTPLMVLALIGLLIGIKKRMSETLVTVIILVIATYTFGSWWSWWFGGAFGHRCYVEFYPLLAFGLGILITWAGRNKYAGAILAALVIACVYYNIRLTYLYVYPWEGWSWTWERYWETVKSIL